MAGSTGDFIAISPERLREVSPQFSTAAHDTSAMISQLNQTTTNLVSDMYSSQLLKSPDALDTLWNKWRQALTNLASSMQTVATNLDTAAASYQHTDQHAMPHGPR